MINLKISFPEVYKIINSLFNVYIKTYNLRLGLKEVIIFRENAKKIRELFKKNLRGIDLEDIVDIVMFGSVVKGKEFPTDIDICIIFRKEINHELVEKISLKLKKMNFHISALTVDNFFRKPHSLIKTILVEGKSILSGKKLTRNFGFSAVQLYSYDLSKLKPSDKVRFVYLLKGRKNTIGIVKKLNGVWLADSCFFIPIESDNEMSNILKKWSVRYIKKEILIH